MPLFQVENMFIDAHSHLDGYKNTLKSVLEEIAQHRIFTISNSIDMPSYKRNLEIGKMCELVLPIFGVHPWKASENVDHLEDLSDAIEQSPILGEIGLDHYFVEDVIKYSAQRKVFEFFLAKAKEQEKIVILHTTGAEKDVMKMLDRYDIQRAIVHWYAGPLDVLHELVAKGTYFTIGVEVLYSEHIQRIAQELLSELLLTETDNPGGWKWLAGKPGMPILVIDVVRKLAELRETTVELIVQTVQDNFARLIRDDPWLSETHAKAFEG